MGRYSTDTNQSGPAPSNQNNVTPPNSYGQQSYNNSLYDYQQRPGPPSSWPTVFPKPIVGLDLNGTIIEDKLLNNTGNVIPLPGALDAVRSLRLKGYKVGIISDQPGIMRNQMTPQDMENALTTLMNMFGQSGIFTIDGVLYNTSNIPQDEYAKPNIGMMQKMQNESGGEVNFKKGWYAGDSMDDLKMADKAGAKPVLVLTGNGQKTLKELGRHHNKDLKKKTLVFDNLLDFANSL